MTALMMGIEPVHPFEWYKLNSLEVSPRRMKLTIYPG